MGVGLQVHLRDRVETLTLAEKHLLEIAKAFAVRPKLLVLDEPTAPLGGDAVALLFRLVRDVVAAGTSVVYITHRLAEVRELADRVTVLRDGLVRGTSRVDRHLRRRPAGADRRTPARLDVPAQARGSPRARPNFVLSDLTGPGFVSVSASAGRGEIIGVAGVVGNGQSELLRALAGLESFSGTVQVEGTQLGGRDLLNRCAYMPADRLAEGLMMSLSVRENSALSALKKFAGPLLLSRSREVEQVRGSLRSLSVKAPSLDAPVSALSGGNQQKVVISRALLSDPPLLVADEPTQGVDVGARAEIYGILREASSRGVPVIVASSDAKELEGLCDQVLVMSRGHVVETLVGAEVTEERIVAAAVTSTTEVVRGGRRTTGGERTGAAPVHPGRLHTLGAAARRDGRSRRLHHPGERPVPVHLQHREPAHRRHRHRADRPRAEHRPAHRRHRPIGRATRGLPRRRGLRSTSTTANRQGR